MGEIPAETELTELAEFQAHLLDLLHAGVTGETLRREIRARHPQRYSAWVDQFDADAEQIGVLIVQRWGRRSSDRG